MTTQTNPDFVATRCSSPMRARLQGVAEGHLLHNVPMAQQAIWTVCILNRSATIGASDRLMCLELMRDKAAFSAGRAARALCGQDHSPDARRRGSMEHFQTLLPRWKPVHALLGRCENAGSPLESHAALIVQRAMRYVGLQMLIAGFAYKRFDGVLWSRLHRLCGREADARGLVSKRIKGLRGLG